MYKLEKPAVQHTEGAFPVPYPAAADVVHSWPPFAQSHCIFSLLSHVKTSSLSARVLSPNNQTIYPL